MIHITIDLPPVTKKNSGQIIRTAENRPRVIPSKAYREYEEACGYFLKPYGIEGPINVMALYYMPTHRRVDISNLHNALHDVLVKHKVITDDNSNVIASTDGSRVLYDKDNPRTEIYITDPYNDKGAAAKLFSMCINTDDCTTCEFWNGEICNIDNPSGWRLV